MQPKLCIISLFLVPFLCFGQHNNFQENKKRTQQILSLEDLYQQEAKQLNENCLKNKITGQTFGTKLGGGLSGVMLLLKIIKHNQTHASIVMMGIGLTMCGAVCGAVSGNLCAELENYIDKKILNDKLHALETFKNKALSENLHRIATTGACSDCYLANAHLSSAITEYNKKNPTNTGIDLSGAYCPNADFSGANLNNANLSHAQLQNANFEKSDLTGANLSHAYIDGANFKKTHLRIKYDELDIDKAHLDAHGLAELLKHALSKSKS